MTTSNQSSVLSFVSVSVNGSWIASHPVAFVESPDSVLARLVTQFSPFAKGK